MPRHERLVATQVQTTLAENQFPGHVFAFRGRRGDLLKLLWWSGDGLCLMPKRLERSRFVWPQAGDSILSNNGASWNPGAVQTTMRLKSTNRNEFQNPARGSSSIDQRCSHRGRNPTLDHAAMIHSLRCLWPMQLCSQAAAVVQ